MKFVHTADLHIGATPEKNTQYGEERREAIAGSLAKIVDLCNDESADLLIISGDLFNRQPLRSELKEAAYEFSRLTTARVVMCAGNHDYLSESNPMADFDFGENVFMISSKTPTSVYFEDIITEVHGLSYYGKNVREPLYDSLKPANDGRLHILMAHGGDENNIPIHLPALAMSGFDYVALGHIHQPRVFKGTHMAYCGSPEPLDRTDIGPRGCLIGELTRETFSLGWHQIAEGQYRSLDIEVNPDTTQAEVIDYIRAQAAQNPGDYLLVNLKGSRDPQLDFDTERISRISRVLEVKDETSPAFNIEKLLAEHKNDLISHYISAFEGKDDEVSKKALNYGLKALLK